MLRVRVCVSVCLSMYVGFSVSVCVVVVTCFHVKLDIWRLIF